MRPYTERLREAMLDAGFIRPNGEPDQTALANKIKSRGGNITPQNIQYLLDPKKNVIGSKFTPQIAAACGVSAIWLATEEGAKTPGIDINVHTSVTRSSPRAIPVISTIPAGGAKEIVDAYAPGAGSDEIIPDTDVGPYAFGLIIDGESMLTEFVSGDKVIIDPDVRPRPGDFVAFKCRRASDMEAGSTFKQYRPRGMNDQGVDYFELVPLNPNYPTLRSDHMECEIIGTMVEHRRYRRRR